MAITTRRPSKAQLRKQRMQDAIDYPLDWIEERTGLVGAVRYFLFRKVPSDTNWMQTLGSATLTARRFAGARHQRRPTIVAAATGRATTRCRGRGRPGS